MPTVEIRKSRPTETQASVFDEIAELTEQIRQRAFELFEGRGRADGLDIDDWLNAEKELVCCPESEMVDKNENFDIVMAMPGFQPDEIKVTALPDELIVKADSSLEHEENQSGTQVSEFGQRTVLRRFQFPQAVDVDRITARLDKRRLHLVVPKLRAAHSEAENKAPEPQAAGSSAASTATTSSRKTATASRG